ncbi:MAG: sugar phosphate isomerase/epimerase [Gemmatimonadetes bacterium]|jgi:sugar phosphate isomerase/epimerase|nr:sugar phosphate isomerase/epimerase [Gemmatimonadota bacterium]MBT6148383.1 sugar phosphate isomerase/epimerase [Gemmatimonadota bacterium]MBT7862796.1 sugar phosphate isomerase/epimerase [Gemmatimonadota bacterium]
MTRTTNSLSLGLSTCIVRPNKFDPATHLPAFAAAGFEWIELNCFLGSDDFSWDRPAQVAELACIAADVGIGVYSVHAEGGIGGYRGRRSEQLAVDVLKCFADLAAELGARVVPFHAGLDATQDRDRAECELRSSLDMLSHHAAGLPCRFGWENEPIGLSTTEHLTWIRDLDPETFCFVLDNGHSHIADTTNAYREACGDLLGSLHLNDNDGARDGHVMPGAGTFDWNGFMPWLASTVYEGPLMLETEARDQQDDLPAVLSETFTAVEHHILRR